MVDRGDQKASLKYLSLFYTLIAPEHYECPFPYHNQPRIEVKCQQQWMVLQKLPSCACSAPEEHYVRKDILIYTI